MYLVLLVVGFCGSYLALLVLFRAFFRADWRGLRAVSLYSLAQIVALSAGMYFVSASIADPWWSNRFLHALAGGFTAYFICFRVVRDGALRISAFQFFVFSALVVTAMGVGNEIVEYFLQNSTTLVFAADINDTWLDLLCNTVGLLLGGVVFTILLSRTSSDQNP